MRKTAASTASEDSAEMPLAETPPAETTADGSEAVSSDGPSSVARASRAGPKTLCSLGVRPPASSKQFDGMTFYLRISWDPQGRQPVAGCAGKLGETCRGAVCGLTGSCCDATWAADGRMASGEFGVFVDVLANAAGSSH